MTKYDVPDEGHPTLVANDQRNGCPSATSRAGKAGNHSSTTTTERMPLPPAAPPELIGEIIGHHRKRCFAMKQRIRIDNAFRAYIRVDMGWSLALPEKERKAIEKRAAKAAADANGPYQDLIPATQASREPWDAIERAAERAMSKAACRLPAWSNFAEQVKGFGATSLAVIIGETGDLSGYASDAKLWKRMGLAVIDGKRQGGLSKSASKEEWIAHGYKRARRSQMWVIGDSLISAQIRKVKDGDGDDTGERIGIGKYGQIYLRRKAFEIARNPEISQQWAHRRAQRYMEKRLLRDLLRAWHKTVPDEAPKHPSQT